MILLQKEEVEVEVSNWIQRSRFVAKNLHVAQMYNYVVFQHPYLD